MVFVVALATAAGMVLGFTGSFRRSLVVLIGFTFLVPAGLPVGHLPGLAFLPASRLVLLAVLAKLIVSAVRGELPPGLFDVTPVHAVFALFLGVALVVGVALAAPATDVVNAAHLWVTYASMLVFFSVSLALVRAIADEAWVVRVVMVVFAVAAGIALVEYLTSLNWNSLLYGGHPPNTAEAEVLHERLGKPRVRGPSAFPLAFAWLLVPAMLAAFVTGLRAIGTAGRSAAGVVFVVMVAAAYLTYTRSIVAPIVVLVVLVPFLTGRRALWLGTAAAAALIGAVYALAPSFGHHFSQSADQGSIHIRFQRIPTLLADLAPHAYSGLGLGGLNSVGIPTTDATYLLIYGSLGVIGVAVLAALQIAALVVSGRALLTSDQGRRDVATMCFLGILVLTGAGFAFDAVSVIQVQDLLWLLVAVCVAIAEREFGAIRWLARPSLPRLGAFAAALGAGFLATAAAPTTYAATVVFGTVPESSTLATDTSYRGFVDVNSICDLVGVDKRPAPDTTVRCDDFLHPPGQGQLRIEAPDVASAKDALANVTSAIYTYPRLRGFRLADQPRFRKAKPTALRTAPVWMPIFIGVGLMLIPDERRTERSRATPWWRTDRIRPGPSG